MANSDQCFPLSFTVIKPGADVQGLCFFDSSGAVSDTVVFRDEGELVWDWRADAFFWIEPLEREGPHDIRKMRCECYSEEGELRWIRDLSRSLAFPSASGGVFVSASGLIDPSDGPRAPAQFVRRDGAVVTVRGLIVRHRGVAWEDSGDRCRILAATGASRPPPLSFVDSRHRSSARLLCYTESGGFLWERRVDATQMRDMKWGSGVLACLGTVDGERRHFANSLQVYDDAGNHLWARHTGDERMSVYRQSVSPDGSAVWCIVADDPPHLYEEARINPRLECFDTKTAELLVDIALPVDTSSERRRWPVGLRGIAPVVSPDGERVCVILEDGLVLVSSDGQVLNHGPTDVEAPQSAIWLSSEVLVVYGDETTALYEVSGAEE
jgi:hypothetical protein